MDLFVAFEASALAEHLRWSRYAYPLVNALHIVGIAMVFGAILPLDLRMMGAFRAVPLDALTTALRPVAVAGLGLAVVSGALLFSVRASQYAGTGLFLVKMGLIALAALNALALSGPRLAAASPARLRAAGGTSLALWLAAIFAGRWLGYLD